MILTVTLNPTLDRVVEIPNFEVGKVNGIEGERMRIAGGKGINVSRVVKALGAKTVATGWTGGKNGKFIEESLREEGIATDFVKIKEENRVNLTILDPIRDTQTHLVERGPNIFEEEIAQLRDKLKELTKEAEVVVFSGSVPRGVSDDIYYHLIRLTHEQKNGLISILDTRGKPLKEGIEAKPFMIKPNEEEIRQLMGKEFSSEEELIQEARSICEKNDVKLVVVSRGKRGAIVITRKETLMVIPPQIKPLNTVGAGDALVAGFAVGLSKGKKLEETSRLGVAAGVASAKSGREKLLSLKEVRNLSEKVKIIHL